MKDFVQTSLKSFVISQLETHVGIIQYGDKADIMIKPKDGITFSKLDDVTRKLSRIGGARRMNKALRLVNSEIYGQPGETRPNAKKVLILLTTGKNSGDGSGELPRVARQLRDQGVQIVVVAIGKDVDSSEVDTITGKKGGSVAVEDPNNLQEAVGQLEEKLNDVEGEITLQIFLWLYSVFCFKLITYGHKILYKSNHIQKTTFKYGI